MPDTKKKVSARKKTTKSPAVPSKRQRLSPEIRRAHLLDAAAKLTVRQGYLPLPLERLAVDAGTSKALIYTYFPTQYDLLNALLRRELNGLTTAGLTTASQVKDLQQAVLLCAMLYFEHVAQSGPLIRIIISDLFMAGHLDAKVVKTGTDMLKRLARLSRGTLPLTYREALAALLMMASIPEESGSLAYHRELDPKIARQACHMLISSSLDALRKPLALDEIP